MKIFEISRGQQELDELLAKNAYLVLHHYIDGPCSCGPCVHAAHYFEGLVKDLHHYIEAGHLILAKMNVEISVENEMYCDEKELVDFPLVHFYGVNGQLLDGDMPIDKGIKEKIQYYMDTDGVVV